MPSAADRCCWRAPPNRDSDIRQWLHELNLANRPDKGFILLARDDFGLSREQFDLVKDALVAQ